MSIGSAFRHPGKTFGSWSTRRRVAAVVAPVAATALVVVILANGSGAYQSFTFPGGHLHGNGAVMTGSSNDASDFTLNHQQPGVEQFHDFTLRNNSDVPVDAWLTFNKTALSALNNLGTYGHFDITVTVGGATSTIFSSDNLNDRKPTCGDFSPTGCWPIPAQIKLAANLGVNKTVAVELGFNYAGKTVHVPATFNEYPIPNGTWPANPDGQFYANPVDGSGDGLPYTPVFMQVGHDPA